MRRGHAWALFFSLFPCCLIFAQIIFVALFLLFLVLSMHVLVCWCFQQKNEVAEHIAREANARMETAETFLGKFVRDYDMSAASPVSVVSLFGTAGFA